MLRQIGQAELDAFNTQGYVILRGAFTKKRVQSLVDAVNRLLDRALAGEVEVPWINKEQRVPGRLERLLHPERYDDAYGRWLDEDVIPQIEPFCGGPARYSLFGMLNSGGGQAYRQAWHRDLGKPGEADEADYLKRHHGRYVQFNAPILDYDAYLHIVPGSHLRASTPEELRAAKDGDDAKMPGGMAVELEPGDIAYYNDNMWHRGWNPEGKDRWTMHAFFFNAEYPVTRNESGQRALLETPGHMESLPPLTRRYVQRYLDAYPLGEPVRMTDL